MVNHFHSITRVFMHGKLFGNNMSVYILSHNDTFLQTNYIIFPHPTTYCFRQLNAHLPNCQLSHFQRVCLSAFFRLKRGLSFITSLRLQAVIGFHRLPKIETAYKHRLCITNFAGFPFVFTKKSHSVWRLATSTIPSLLRVSNIHTLSRHEHTCC